jgi:hypothetical protein
MVTVGLYIYINDVARRIELFEDEKISINSSVQNASDISKIYTDFSQSFTIPANERNNAIFSHWYESSIDGGFDARQRKKAYIELDTIPFRKGNIQLEKATIKNGVPENYTITFFGSLVSLKDTFAGKKLSELDFSDYNINYSPTEVINRVKDGVNNDVKFPLITSNRLWSDVGAENITGSSYPILYNELFPALRISKIFEAIADTYGITFNGSFLSNQKFTRAFLWLKNSDLFISKSSLSKINFNTSSGFPIKGWIFSTLQDTLIYTSPISFEETFVSLSLTTTTTDVNYNVIVYKDGVQYLNIPCPNTSSATNNFDLMNFTSYNTENSGTYEFYIQSENIITFTSQLTVEAPSSELTATATQSTSQTTSSVLNISSYMPDMKVEDFFIGILKMFNLTCLGYEENVYTIEQLEDWYAAGDIKDISKHTLSDDFDISKLETFKKINFNYTKSESFMNVKYLSDNGFEYGDLKADLNSEGSEYNVQLPFENLLFNKFTGQNLQVGYSLKTDFKPYIPKPIILYDYGTLQSCNFYLKGTGSATNITTYNAFGQDTLISSVNHSLNFGLDISSLLLTPINNSLYADYYQSYLENIYNQKARKYDIKALLPISLLTSIKLNNRLIIRDKRYIINNMKIDLTSGEVDFELINDFRTL